MTSTPYPRSALRDEIAKRFLTMIRVSVLLASAQRVRGSFGLCWSFSRVGFRSRKQIIYFFLRMFWIGSPLAKSVEDALLNRGLMESDRIWGDAICRRSSSRIAISGGWESQLAEKRCKSDILVSSENYIFKTETKAKHLENRIMPKKLIIYLNFPENCRMGNWKLEDKWSNFQFYRP